MAVPPAERREPDSRNARQVGRLVKALWFAAGTFFLAVGMVGVVIPILPTTPFLLLAAACYLRSSKRTYDWMMNNKLFGKYLSDYQEGRGISWRVKIGTIAFLWIVILTSVLFFAGEMWLRALLVLIAAVVTIHVVTIKPKKKGSDASLQSP